MPDSILTATFIAVTTAQTVFVYLHVVREQTVKEYITHQGAVSVMGNGKVMGEGEY